MKTKKFFSLALASSVAIMAVLGSAQADLVINPGITAFNSLNSGKGYMFNYTVNGQEAVLTNAGVGMPSLSAYAGTTSASNYFNSFCVESNQGIEVNGGPYSALLNYAGGVTKNSSGATLSLGAAVLATKYATGTLAGFNYTGSASMRQLSASVFQQAINVLMGSQTVASWSSNTFLNYLLTLNSSQAYWKANYNPSGEYAEIGNYSVLIMQVKNNLGTAKQDFFYVMQASPNGGGVIPEPATVLLWSLGSLGAFGMAWNRRRKNAIAS